MSREADTPISSGSDPARPRAIIHVDMDAFYASVEERDDPSLVGRPVIVGGSPTGRGVVAAANYEARRFGVRSALPSARARALCPHAVFIRSRMAHYVEVSAAIRRIFERYSPLIEPLSLDEAFLDVAASERLFGGAVEIGRRLKRDIGSEVGLVASVGVAHNKFLAKLASDLEKPDGFVVVDPRSVHDLLDPLPVSRLWGVGRRGEDRLRERGLETIGDVRHASLDRLRSAFGGLADHIHALADGRDGRRVTPDRTAKSLSHETTFETDVSDRETLRAVALDLTANVARRLRAAGLTARGVQLKLRFADFRTITRAALLPCTSNGTQALWRAARQLLRDNHRGDPVRLIGVGVSRLGSAGAGQLDLVARSEQRRETALDDVADRIQLRFGHRAVTRAGALLPGPGASGAGAGTRGVGAGDRPDPDDR